MAFSVTKHLVCPSCGVVLATATYRRFPGRLVVTLLDGAPLPPESVGLQLARAKSRAAADPRDPAAADRLAFLQRHLDGMVFDIPCPNGHSLLRTMPQLARSIRTSPGDWVDLSH
jgi:hypothetical protein